MTVREGLQIEISGIPAENGKCRVETQLKITFQLKDAQGDIVKDWKQLRLPRPLIAKEKHRMEKFNGRGKHIQDSEILTLETRLVCDHDMSKVLECCDNCIGRERKRAHRRKESHKLPGPLSSIPIFGSVSAKNAATVAANEADPPTPTDPEEYQAWERSRIMVFSSTEYVDISSGQCLLPTRITCYCRHHNEKVGFRIQFTAKDSTGAVVATVLTNPVMMMDDHKSGKRVNSVQPRNAAAAGSSSITKKSKAVAARATDADGAVEQSDNIDHSIQHEHDEQEEEDDMDQDEDIAEEQDEIDLEAGHHIPHHDYSESSLKFEGSEILSGDILTPLTSAADRLGAKRRVEDNTMEDVQMQLLADSTRGPFRRKTSHDVAMSSSGSPALFTSSSLSFPSSTMITSQSPFMLGSPFANEGSGNAFAPSFAETIRSGESFLDQKNIDMFLQTGLPTSRGMTAAHRPQSRDLVDHEASMMEFTTLDESMSSPPESFHSSSLNSDTSVRKAGQRYNQSPITTGNHTLATRISTSIPASSDSPPVSSSSTSTVGPNPFSAAGMFNSAFSATFSAPPTAASNSATYRTTAPGTSSSFLDASQIQEFENFKRQSVQQKQQQLLMQLQQGIQPKGDQQPAQIKSVPWTNLKSDNKDPFWNMRAAMSQTTNPLSSAFIPTSASVSDESAKNTAATGTNAASAANSTTDTPLAPKKRGRPRKTAAPPVAPESNSPVLSPKIPAVLPSSPSPPPMASPSTTSTSSAAAAAAAAAQFMLFQQRQQQQFQQHQQQLQQQQKQAILARQKPRIQKLIPARGAVEGGAEITLLGSGFFPGMIPTFDGVPALSVQYYGPETMICRLPPRNFPGTVVVKAQGPLNALASGSGGIGAGVGSGPSGSGSGMSGGVGKDDDSSSDLVRTMNQLFGGPSGIQSNGVLDDDVGVLFEYEESKGDRDLIALALQVLGMKMNGRVESPHQVAMRIMGTAAISNASLGSGGATDGQLANGHSQGQLQQPQQTLPQQQQQLQLQQYQQQPLVGFGGLQQNALSQQSALTQQLQLQRHGHPLLQLQHQQAGFGSMAGQSSSMLGTGMHGFGNYMNLMGVSPNNGNGNGSNGL
ncbi:hypothetical protein EDD11_009251 [Mortierella claussenii]|nr:hypothetical protein EDD11_009251 [Mortierella claussenii]